MNIVNGGPQVLVDRLVARIEREGPLPFDQYLEAALYDPEHGFYATGGSAGRRDADFLTSPEVGPLFGAVVARALDVWWQELGRPDLFTVVECGAGRGALAQAVTEATPECMPALRYLLVERSSALRDRQREHLELVTGAGPGIVSLDVLPDRVGPGVVLANELLDNLPWRLVERRDEGWAEIRVGAGIEGFVEQVVPADTTMQEVAGRLAPAARPGARLPIQQQARTWVESAAAILDRGRVVALDYTTTTEDLARRPPSEWLRTYRGHGHGSGPLDAPGTQDITCEVALDQLPVPSRKRRQTQFLVDHGIVELAEEGRRQWERRAHIGDLAAIRARSRVAEAQALTERGGLGDFVVLEWVV